MTSRGIDFAAHRELHRGYLTALEGVHVGPELRGKLDPADLVRQALLEACRGRDASRGKGTTQFRARHRRGLSPEDLLDDSSRRPGCPLEDGGLGPGHKASRREQALLPADALARLPGDRRPAVELRHLGGESLERIAGRVGRSVPAVAGLLRRGLRTLRSGLDVPA